MIRPADGRIQCPCCMLMSSPTDQDWEDGDTVCPKCDAWIGLNGEKPYELNPDLDDDGNEIQL
jgi:hypothetical protein